MNFEIGDTVFLIYLKFNSLVYKYFIYVLNQLIFSQFDNYFA